MLYDAEVQNYARYQEGELIYTTVLHLLNVNFTDEGRYQCVVSNHFGSNYSNRAKLTVNGEDVFLSKNVIDDCQGLPAIYVSLFLYFIFCKIYFASLFSSLSRRNTGFNPSTDTAEYNCF